MIAQKAIEASVLLPVNLLFEVRAFDLADRHSF